MLKVVARILAVVAIIGIAWILVAHREARKLSAADQKALGTTMPAEGQAAPPAANDAKPSDAAPAESAATPTAVRSRSRAMPRRAA